MFLEAGVHNIRRRVAIVGVILIIAPMAVVSLAGWAVLKRMELVAGVIDDPGPSSRVNLSHLTENLLEVCRSYHQTTADALKTGQRILNDLGPIRLDESHTSIWHAENELTGEKKLLEIPLLTAGEANFAPVTDFDQTVPVVDEIAKVAGTPATIFQRLNDRGDMLRVASSLKSDQGTRAIGAFTPADGREGQSVKTLQDVLSGNTYIGKEVQGNVSYLTAYQPLNDNRGNVVAMLSTVIPEEQIKAQLRHLAGTSTQSADGPELFVLSAAGEKRGTALVMGNKSLEGSDLWNEKDRSGRLYVQELCLHATLLAAGEIGDYKYQRSPLVGSIPRTMTARFGYVPELDWVVGFAQPEAGVQAGMPAGQALLWAMWLWLGVSVASTGLAVRVWIKFSAGLAPKQQAWQPSRARSIPEEVAEPPRSTFPCDDSADSLLDPLHK